MFRNKSPSSGVVSESVGDSCLGSFPEPQFVVWSIMHSLRPKKRAVSKPPDEARRLV